MTTDGAVSVAPEMAADIVARSQKLLEEMEQLRERVVADQGASAKVQGLRGLTDNLRSDFESANTYLASLTDPSIQWKAGKGNAHSAGARFRSSNVHAVERLWNIIKRCHHLVSINKQLPKLRRPGERAILASSKADNRGTSLVSIHGIVDGGAEWIRIVTKNQKRLLIEMAEGGWDWGLDDEDDEDDSDESLCRDIPTLGQAKELADLARTHWCKYRHPKLRIIFTQITEGQNEEVDKLLGKLRHVGGPDITVAVHGADSEWVTNQPPVDLDTAISNLLPQDDDLGDAVLLDTSVMIALVSDVCHAKLEKMPWMERDLQSHIEDEDRGNVFIKSLAISRLGGKQLLCTEQALEHFQAIVEKIGTPTEMERARMLLESGPVDMQNLSIHSIPNDLMLPLRVLPRKDTARGAAELVRDRILPEVAIQVEEYLDKTVDSNRATHMYGWISNTTVVTSNRTITKKIVQMIESALTEDYEGGPQICALPYNRALATRGPSPKRALKLQRRGIWPPDQPVVE